MVIIILLNDPQVLASGRSATALTSASFDPFADVTSGRNRRNYARPHFRYYWNST